MLYIIIITRLLTAALSKNNSHNSSGDVGGKDNTLVHLPVHTYHIQGDPLT